MARGIFNHKDSEMKARIGGVSASMEIFDFFYEEMLGEMVLKLSDNLVALCSTSQCQQLEARRLLA